MSGCDCVTKVNAALAKAGDNARIDRAILMPGLTEGPAKVATYKADPMKRGKPRSVMASFCPFCGVKYQTGEA